MKENYILVPERILEDLYRMRKYYLAQAAHAMTGQYYEIYKAQLEVVDNIIRRMEP